MSTQNTTDAALQGFDDPVRKMPRWVKWLGGTAVGLVLVAGGAGLVVPQLIDQQKYKTLIIEKVFDKTGYKVDWSGDIGMSLLPLPHVTVSDLTVNAGEQQILAVKIADVEIDLVPLLSGKLAVRDVTLEGPQITLVTDKSGRQTWMTDKIAAPTDVVQDNREEGDGDQTNTAPAAPMDISLNVVEITDGVLVWDDQTAGKMQKIEDVDLRLKADSLTGPFEANGGLLWQGHKIEAKVHTSELDMEQGVYPLQVKLALPEQNILGEYSGVVATKDKLSVEGDVTLGVTDLGAALAGLSGDASPDLPDDLKGKASLSGKLVYSPEKVALGNLQVEAGDLGYGGDFSVTGLDNDKVAPQVSFDLKSNRKAAGNASALLRFLDDLSVSATGSLSGDSLNLVKSRITLDGNDVAMSGRVDLGEKKKVDLIVNVSKLDVDQLRQKLGLGSGAGGAGSDGDAEAVYKSGERKAGFTVPFEGRVRADIDEMRYDQKSYSDIHLDLTAAGGGVNIQKLEAGLPDGVSVKASGTIGDTQSLSGLDVGVSARILDTETLARSYNIALPELPRKLGTATIDGKISGDPKALGFDLKLGVWGMTASGAGTLANLLDTPVINRLAFSVKHPSFVEAMRIVQPGFNGSSSLSGPLNLSGNVAWGDDQYHLSDLDAMLGKTSVKGNMDVALTPKPSVSGELAIGDLVLPDQSGGASSSSVAAGAKSSAAAKGGARWSREAIDVVWLKNFNADLKLSVNHLRYNLWDFNAANLDFVLKDGTLSLNDMSAGLFGGQASVSGQVKSGAGERDPLGVTGGLKASGVDAAKLQSALVGKASDTVSGTITNADVSIAATGLSPAALVQTLSGKGALQGRDIVVRGIDAAKLGMAAKGSYKPLDRAGTLFGSFGDGQTEFTTFDSAFDIQNGVVDFTRILFDGPKAMLEGTGQVNLPLWTIDLTNRMTVKDTDIPPFEFTVRGPLDNPAKAGGDVIENYLRGKFEKKVNKLLEKQIGKLLGGGGNGGTSPESVSTPEQDGMDGGAAQPDAAAPVPAPEATQPEDPKDALKKDALKALGGLLAQ